jgi:Leucine rich repeat
MDAEKKVTVKLGDAKQTKPTNSKKNTKSQPDVDLNKEFMRARDEGITRLNLSKNNITIVPPSIKECCSHLAELYLYGNKISSLPIEIGQLTHLQTLALNENQVSSKLINEMRFFYLLVCYRAFSIKKIIYCCCHFFSFSSHHCPTHFKT